MIEPFHQVPGQFQVLALVFAHRHRMHLVDQNVRRHQHRIGEKTQVLAGAVGFFLELGHPVELADPGDGGKHPRQFGVLGTCDWK